MLLADYILQKIDFNKFFKLSEGDRIQLRNGLNMVSVEGIGLLPIYFPNRPQLTIISLEVETDEEVLAFYKRTMGSFLRKEYESFTEWVIEYAFGRELKVLRLYDSDKELIDNRMIEILEKGIQEIEDFLMKEVKQALSNSDESGLDINTYKTEKINTLNEYLHYERVFFTPKELEEHKRNSTIPFANPSQYETPFIKQINQFINKGGMPLDAIPRFPFDKVCSTIAIKRVIKKLKNPNFEIRNNQNDFSGLSNKLNDLGYTLNCNPDILKAFLSKDADLKEKIVWIKKGRNKKDRGSLFVLLGIYRPEILLDTSQLYSFIIENVRYGESMEEDKKTNLKASFNKWYTRYIKDKEKIQNDLKALLSIN